MNIVGNWLITLLVYEWGSTSTVPVPIMLFEIVMFWVFVTWMPSVLGLVSGAVTVRYEAWTLVESSKSDVHLLGVLELQILHHQVIAFVECHSLQTSRKPLINFELNATVREIQAAESFQVLILNWENETLHTKLRCIRTVGALVPQGCKLINKNN